MRHAKAVELSEAASDAARELVPEGIERSRAVGRALAALFPEPDAIVTSPLLRARQTAAEIAGELGLDVTEDRAVVGLVHPKVLARHGERLIVVGHEPDFSGVVRALTGARIDFPKAGAACLRDDELRWFMRPSQLELVSAR